MRRRLVEVDLRSTSLPLCEIEQQNQVQNGGVLAHEAQEAQGREPAGWLERVELSELREEQRTYLNNKTINFLNIILFGSLNFVIH